VDAALFDQVFSTCRDLVAPLVIADGGEMYLVAASAEDVHIHLAGTCAGCPGASMTRERLVQPAIANVAPKASVRITTGWKVPTGAKKVVPA
jgi:Fe-S cluster biogenesis protein NfuA